MLNGHISRPPFGVLTRAWCVLAGLLCGAAGLKALNPAQKIAQLAHTVWSRERGDMPATVTAVVQTRDGRLWVGTDTGLLQFDGERFEAWQPPANQQLTSDR